MVYSFATSPTVDAANSDATNKPHVTVQTGIMENNDDEPVEVLVVEEQRDAEPTTMISADESHKVGCEGDVVSFSSVFQDISLFRDFFLAAFSDGHNSNNNNNSTWCGDEGFSECCSTKKVAPAENAAFRKTRSAGGAYDANLQQSTSMDSRGPRRNKPLAVAVGFNYAEDPNGRPIVVTPTGSSHSPIDVTNVRLSSTGRPMPARSALRSQSGSPNTGFILHNQRFNEGSNLQTNLSNYT